MLFKRDMCWHSIRIPRDDIQDVTKKKGLFSQLLPPPPSLSGIGAFEVGAYHLFFGDRARARDLLESINEWPFSSDTPPQAEIRAFARGSSALSAASGKAAKVLRETGALTPNAWKEQNWGAEQDVQDFTFVSEQGLTRLEFQSESWRPSYLPGVTQLFTKYSAQKALVAEPKGLKIYRLEPTTRGLAPFALEVLQFESAYELEEAWETNMRTQENP